MDTHAKEWIIYADDLQEGDWFKALHPGLGAAREEEISGAVERNPLLERVLLYDRPDIVLASATGAPVLVVERTIEVPSGHNVGQRFARLAAAAEAGVPLVYFGPYAARKHGGKTAGPRYMNLRLFRALDKVAQVTGSAVTTIRWPVDDSFEIVFGATADERMTAYLDLFFALHDRLSGADLHSAIMNSEFEQAQEEERRNFEATIQSPEQYDSPPPSVALMTGIDAAAELDAPELAEADLVVCYSVGMRYVRSDPYTGMAILYRYLYVLGEHSDLRLVLRFPHISLEMWEAAAKTGKRKDVRLFRIAADGIRFSDDYRGRGSF